MQDAITQYTWISTKSQTKTILAKKTQIHNIYLLSIEWTIKLPITENKSICTLATLTRWLKLSTMFAISPSTLCNNDFCFWAAAAAAAAVGPLPLPGPPLFILSSPLTRLNHAHLFFSNFHNESWERESIKWTKKYIMNFFDKSL